MVKLTQLRNWLLYFLILTIFLEAPVFSFYFLGGRVRIAQLFEAGGLLFLFCGYLLGRRIIRTPLGRPLSAYLAINFLALFNAVWFLRGLKIFLLLAVLILLYYLVYNLITSKNIFDKAFDLLLYTGLGEMAFGLYQVLAGIINFRLGTNFYIGYLGLVHSDFIGSFWGRPYGTMVEPDWYGALALFYSLVFIILYYSKIERRKKIYFIGLIFSLAGLFLSFVRAAWLGFILGLIFFLVIKNRTLLKKRLSKINFIFVINWSIVLLGLIFVLIFVSSSIRNIFEKRFHPTYYGAGFSLENQRFYYTGLSWRAFINHPLIGNGPGSAAYLYLAEKIGGEAAQNIIENRITIPDQGFDFGLINTILEDTGLMGLIIFLYLVSKVLSYNLKEIPRLEEEYQIISLSLLTGLAGLFISFLFTQGLWMPFTWVFLAFNMAVLKFIKEGLNFRKPPSGKIEGIIMAHKAVNGLDRPAT